MRTQPPEEHDLGLRHDIQIIADRIRQRRRVLSWMLAGGTIALLPSCGGSSGDSTSSTDSSTATTTTSTSTAGSTSAQACLADPAETSGPFPSDGSNTVDGSVSNVLMQSGVVRSDIRSSFGSSTSTAPGVPLTITLSLVNSNNSCAALSGYAVYIWHCNRDGEYSLYGSDILDENYLRGVQVSDSLGAVTFETIYPACYSGRYPHIHVEVYPSLSEATVYTNATLTSQLAMPRDISETVYQSATGYSASVTNLADVTTSSDGVFDASSAAQLAMQTPALTGSVTDGFVATVTVGVPV